jgi:hypothetical protein
MGSKDLGRALLGSKYCCFRQFDGWRNGLRVGCQASHRIFLPFEFRGSTDRWRAMHIRFMPDEDWYKPCMAHK